MEDINWALARKKQAMLERARIIQEIRAFFIEAGFLEIETPYRIPANAPEPHIDILASEDWFLQSSPELAMKRLLAAGFDRLFQVCRVWRRNERGQRHLPEFTLLEWYRPLADYRALMEDCICLLRRLCPCQKLSREGRVIALDGPWQLLSVHEAFIRYGGMSMEQALQKDRFDEILVNKIEPHLGQEKPTFLIDYPVELGALARTKPENPSLAERFELYVCGVELANGFSELNDPTEQAARFARDERRRREAGKTAFPSPEKFLKELKNMPQAAGIALGVDRLVMLLTGHADITEVVAFTPEQL